ncbi:MAG: transaldolase family protein [Anaerolineaceae bacterium]
MNKTPYFQRVKELSPTRFWINNPTKAHTEMAIATGAVGCTANPSFSQKMLDHPVEGKAAWPLLREAVQESENEYQAAEIFQRKLIKPICDRFMPIYRQDPSRNGFVSIQGDPIDDENVEGIIRQARENRAVAENICCKIPATKAGLEAMEVLVAENTAINATEIFCVAQMVYLCETYEKVVKKTGKRPPLFMSHIAGIYDDHFKAYVEREKVDIAPDVLWQAGLAVARKVYDLMTQRGYTAIFVGGGARGLHHFTEMVGGDVCITINWEGTADKLIELDPPVVYRLFNPVPQKVIDELTEKLPDFKRGYLEDGLSLDEFEGFGPVQLFRSSFTKSWKRVLELSKTTREEMAV